MKKMILTLAVFTLLAGPLTFAGDLFTKHKKSESTFGESAEDTALVYVIRPSTMGAAVKTWSFVDDELIGVTRGRGYAFAHVTPGERLFWSKAENTDALTVTVEAGKTYYFKQQIMMGIGKARAKLVPIDEATAAKMLRKCGWAEPTDAGRVRGAEIVVNRLEKAQRSAAKRQSKSNG
jgi:hypothetical protein